MDTKYTDTMTLTEFIALPDAGDWLDFVHVFLPGYTSPIYYIDEPAGDVYPVHLDSGEVIYCGGERQIEIREKR